MNTDIQTFTLDDISIRQEACGRHCINDLLKAAVANGANAHSKSPAKFFRSPRIKKLIALLSESVTQPGVTLFDAANGLESQTPHPNWVTPPSPKLGDAPVDFVTPIWGNEIAPVVTINDGLNNGTYVVIELVIAYGQFVSAAFDLKVIRTFLGVMQGRVSQHAMPHIQSTKFWDLLRPHWAPIARLALAGLKNKQIASQVQRSASSVGRCLRRMFDVGYLNPVQVFQARLSPATAARWALEKPVAADWGRVLPPVSQFSLDFAGAAA